MAGSLQITISLKDKLLERKIEKVCASSLSKDIQVHVSDLFLPFDKEKKVWIVSDFIFLERFSKENNKGLERREDRNYIIIVVYNNETMSKINKLCRQLGWFPDDSLRQDALESEIAIAMNKLMQVCDLENEASILNQTFEYAYNSIVITDKHGVIEYANRFFEKISGYSVHDLKGSQPDLIKSGYHTKNFYRDLWSKIQAGQMWEGIFINKRKSGELFYEEARIVPIKLTHINNDVRYLKIGRNVRRENLHANELTQEAVLAKKLMMAFMPESYKDSRLKVNHALRPYNYLGGDFIVFSKVGESKYRYALIDVMGHGLSSALVGIRCSSVFQSLSSYNSLARSVGVINDMLVDLNYQEDAITKYASGVFIEIDFPNKYIDYISAGHNDFLVKKRNNSIDSRISNNLLIGVHKGFKYRVDRISTEFVKSMLIFTDGLLEYDQNNEPDEIMLEIIKNYKNKNLKKEIKKQANDETINAIDQIMDLTIRNANLKDDVAISEIVFNEHC